MRLLLIEDSEFDAQAIIRKLNKSNHRFDIYHHPNTSAAREFLNREPAIDILVTDNSLPNENGIEFCRDIIQNHGRPFPMVLLTGSGSEKVAARALKSGFNDYIIKDINGEYLDFLPFVLKKLHGRFKDREARRKAEKALAVSAQELAEKNRDLDEFARMVAHDLKNPIGILVGYADALRQSLTSMEADEIESFLKTITKHGRKAAKIVDDLLFLSVVSKGDVTTEVVDMNVVTAESITRSLPAYTNSKPTIIKPCYLPNCLGHRGWIEEILVNFISNGIKYGGSPPIIEIGYSLLPDEMIRYWVKDNGPGIPASMQRKIFEPFKRLHISEAGTGLGLSIVQRIVDKLGGDVGVESQSSQAESGSIFYFDLPSVNNSLKKRSPLT